MSLYVEDFEGDTITWSGVTIPLGLGINAAGDVFGVAGAEGADNMVLRATDVYGDSTDFTVSYFIELPEESSRAAGSNKKRRKTKNRFIIEIEGQVFRVATQQEAVELVQQFRKNTEPNREALKDFTVKVHKGQGKLSIPSVKTLKKGPLLGGKSKSLFDR